MDSLVRRVSLRALDSDTTVLGRLVRWVLPNRPLRKCSSDTSHDFRDPARVSLCSSYAGVRSAPPKLLQDVAILFEQLEFSFCRLEGSLGLWVPLDWSTGGTVTALTGVILLAIGGRMRKRLGWGFWGLRCGSEVPAQQTAPPLD